MYPTPSTLHPSFTLHPHSPLTVMFLSVDIRPIWCWTEWVARSHTLTLGTASRWPWLGRSFPRKFPSVLLACSSMPWRSVDQGCVQIRIWMYISIQILWEFELEITKVHVFVFDIWKYLQIIYNQIHVFYQQKAKHCLLCYWPKMKTDLVHIYGSVNRSAHLAV